VTASTVPGDTRLARSTAAMTALTAVSRLTGFLRVLVVAAVLGTTFLGNTYQSANTVPNLLFELLAAGALQAVLIPSLVELLARDQRDAEHAAGAILGLTLAVLAGLAAIGMVAAPLIMRGLVAGVASAEVRDAQIELGTVFLWFFLPQVVFYAAAMVATGVLNARDRFAVPVFAPVVNNVVVIGAYLLFWRLRDGRPPTLDLTWTEKTVLAGGTTLAVVAFCSLPVIAAIRTGFKLRPNLDRRHPDVRRIVRLSGWAVLYLAMTQVLLLVVLVLANSVEGGVVAYQVAFTFFLLPHALFAIPVLTALFPRLSRQALAEDWAGYAASVERGAKAIAFFVLPATAAFAALAPWATAVVIFGESSGGDSADIASVVRGFAPGLLGYGGMLFLTRCFYAVNDTRTPALVNGAAVLAGSVAMAVAAALADGTGRVTALAGAHSATYLVGAAALFVLLERRVLAGRTARPPVASPLLRLVLAAAVAFGVMLLASEVVDVDGRLATAAALVAAGGAGGVVYLGTYRVLGGSLGEFGMGALRG